MLEHMEVFGPAQCHGCCKWSTLFQELAMSRNVNRDKNSQASRGRAEIFLPAHLIVDVFLQKLGYRSSASAVDAACSTF